MESTVNIYVITHKSFDDNFIKNNTYKVLLVGKALGNSGKKYYLNDNLGKNISIKNKSYCELTICFLSNITCFFNSLTKYLL